MSDGHIYPLNPPFSKPTEEYLAELRDLRTKAGVLKQQLKVATEREERAQLQQQYNAVLEQMKPIKAQLEYEECCRREIDIDMFDVKND